MQFVQNFPFFSILLCMICGIITSVLSAKASIRLSIILVSVVLILNLNVLVYFINGNPAYDFLMGHFHAPWGNELHVGVLEALIAIVFCIIMLLSILGGLNKLCEQVDSQKQNLYFVMVDLMMAALLALVYTNDMFTAYVFIEINTIAACALIIIRQNGHCLVAGTRYMVMNLLGSGLFLIGISMLYTITGHLLMPNIHNAIMLLSEQGLYNQQIMVVIALITVGLAIKSALWPFHAWVPDSYGYSTPMSSAILSSLASKGYIFLLIKIIVRVFSIELVASTDVVNIMFVFGAIGIVAGSVSAIRQRDIRNMVAYSSVAQIGYIYLGLGLGTKAGVVAAVFQIIAHGACKSMLFISCAGLIDASDDSKQFHFLRGSAYRNVAAGIAFTVGALSMVGVPFLGGFIAKYNLTSAGILHGGTHQTIVIIAMMISTVLNTIYFMHTTISIYRTSDLPKMPENIKSNPILSGVSMILFAAFNIFLGVFSAPIISTIQRGIEMMII